MSSNSAETATILINDFGLKGKTFPVFKVDERNVWLLIPHEIASKLMLEANSHILASNGVAVRFPKWGIDTGVDILKLGDRVRYIGRMGKHKNKVGTIFATVYNDRYRCNWDGEKAITDFLSREELTK
jgi:hypothetical protein